VFLSSGGPGQPCVVVPSDRDLLVTVPDAARGSALQVSRHFISAAFWVHQQKYVRLA
jgi:hypothetical protein